MNKILKLNIKFKNYLVPLVPAVFITLVILVLVVLVFLPKKLPKIEQSLTVEAPSPLASGKQTYEIRTDKPKNPAILEVTLDPLDVKMNETQVITVKIQDTNTDSITEPDSITVTVITDNSSTTFPLKLIQAGGETALLTTWQGSWERKDSYDFKYAAVIKAKNKSGENSVELTFR